MMICTHCQSSLMDGALVCDKCGFNLWAIDKQQTMTTKLDADTGGLKIRSGWGTATLRQRREVLVYVQRSEDPIRITPRDGFLFGRTDKVTGTFPDLDLTPFGAAEKGVSRKHAALILEDEDEDIVKIKDLGSANGTYLNGVQMTVNQERLLRDGDEIRMGSLNLHFYFA
jgi:hypothetical protein